MKESKNRKLWLDVVKGFAMVSVVVSHEFASVDLLVDFLNIYMLPLFFVASGYCLSIGKYTNVSYIKRISKSLLIPYITLGIIVSIIQIPIIGSNEILNNIKTDLFSWQTLWFLPILFCSDIIVYSIFNHFGNKLKIAITVASILLIIAILYAKYNYNFPLHLHVTAIASFYVVLGYAIKSKNIINTKFAWLATICGLVLFILLPGRLNLNQNDILPISKLFISVLITLGVFIVAKNLNLVNHSLFKPLAYIGCNSMVFFALHMPIFFYCQHFVRPIMGNPSIYKACEVIILWSLCYILTVLLTKYTPWILGRYK